MILETCKFLEQLQARENQIEEKDQLDIILVHLKGT